MSSHWEVIKPISLVPEIFLSHSINSNLLNDDLGDIIAVLSWIEGFVGLVKGITVITKDLQAVLNRVLSSARGLIQNRSLFAQRNVAYNGIH